MKILPFDLLGQYRALLTDLGVSRFTFRYLMRRLRCEGAHFVTSLLPSFSKHVLKCYEQGFWQDFGSSIKKGKHCLPVIFQVELLSLFDLGEDGTYRSSCPGDPVALLVIRQACEYCYKLALPFSVDDITSATEKFKEVDASVVSHEDIDEQFVDAMRKSFETYYPRSSSITLHDVALNAHHGPGTFAGCDPRTFWMQNYQHPQVFPEHMDHAYGLRFNHHEPLATVSESDVRFSEVLFVPKDSRGPRTIVREPYENLQFQMGYNSVMADALYHDTRHRINFVDQSVNQAIAQQASIDRLSCTLDLKDASDRVSYAVVTRLFRHTPLLKVVSKFRTRWAKLPDGSFVELKKLSGMGSGFTFPTMALIIHLAICTHISSAFHERYTSVAKQVYVYGDDIILPTKWRNAAVNALGRVGLEVNLTKSFSKGFFRESCGGDYLYGNDVAPVRLKLASSGVRLDGLTAIQPGPRDADKDFFILGIERHARELYKNQLYGAASFCWDYIERTIGRKLPLVTLESPILGRVSTSDDVARTIQYDSTGLSKNEVHLVAIPVSGSVSSPSPYQYLRSLIKFDSGAKWEHKLFPAGRATSGFGTAAIPRRLVLRLRKVRGLARL